MKKARKPIKKRGNSPGKSVSLVCGWKKRKKGETRKRLHAGILSLVQKPSWDGGESNDPPNKKKKSKLVGEKGEDRPHTEAGQSQKKNKVAREVTGRLQTEKKKEQKRGKIIKTKEHAGEKIRGYPFGERETGRVE